MPINEDTCALISGVQRNVVLGQFTGFGIGGPAKFFAKATSKEEVVLYLGWARENGLPILILGGGSNLVVSDEGFLGFVLKIEIRGISTIEQSDKFQLLRVGAGENWDKFVQYTVHRGLWGCENLSLIPGTVGAVPVQNVGAFGQEAENIIYEVYCYDTASETFLVLSKEDCRFSFRRSIFNREESGRFVILSVVFKLSSAPTPRLTRAEFKHLRTRRRTCANLLQDIRSTVCAYRTNGRNLPAGEHLGSCGTFFRTAVIASYADFFRIVSFCLISLGPIASLKVLAFGIRFRTSEGLRLPSKHLIRLCGADSYREGAFSLLEGNPAVVVSDRKSEPKSADLDVLVSRVRQVIKAKTSAEIPIEPVLVGFETTKNHWD